MKRFLVALFFCLMSITALSGHASESQVGAAPKLYELRIYTSATGRLGDLQSIMQAKGLTLFAKYGIHNIFEGTVLEGAPVDGSDAPNMLICILAHDSREAAKKAWQALEADEEWKTAWAHAESSQPLLTKAPVSIFLNPTEFSPAPEPPTAAGAPSRVFELRKYNTGPERLADTVDEFKEGLAAILTKVGMTPIIYWTADDRSSFVYLLAHKDREAARASWAAFRPEFRPFMNQFNAKRGVDSSTTPPGRRTPDDNRFLVPTVFSPLR